MRGSLVLQSQSRPNKLVRQDNATEMCACARMYTSMHICICLLCKLSAKKGGTPHATDLRDHMTEEPRRPLISNQEWVAHVSGAPASRPRQWVLVSAAGATP